MKKKKTGTYEYTTVVPGTVFWEIWDEWARKDERHVYDSQFFGDLRRWKRYKPTKDEGIPFFVRWFDIIIFIYKKILYKHEKGRRFAYFEVCLFSDDCRDKKKVRLMTCAPVHLGGNLEKNRLWILQRTITRYPRVKCLVHNSCRLQANACLQGKKPKNKCAEVPRGH